MERASQLTIQSQEQSPDRLLAARRHRPLHQRVQNETQRLASAVETTLRYMEEMRGRSPPAA
jgi:hypothetical protein